MKRLKFLGVIVAALMTLTAHAETRVHTFARAVARTEGFYVRNTIPNRLHNPGDIRTRLAHAYPGQTGTYHGYAVFKNDAWGWAALESQIQRVIDGTSRKYDQSMTMTEIAKVYAENWRYWGRTVCSILKISPDLTFQEYFGLAPRVRYTYDIPMWLRNSGNTVPAVLPVLEVPPQIHRETRWQLVAAMPQWTTGEIE